MEKAGGLEPQEVKVPSGRGGEQEEGMDDYNMDLVDQLRCNIQQLCIWFFNQIFSVYPRQK
jgi:hypothetical protein